MDSGSYKPKDRLISHGALKPVLRNGRETFSGGDLPALSNADVYVISPGDHLILDGASADIKATLDKDGSLTIQLDGRTIVLEGYVAAQQQGDVSIARPDGEILDIPAILKDTDPKVDLTVLAGPHPDSSGVYVPFTGAPGLDGLLAVGILDPTAFGDKTYDYNDKEQLVYASLDDGSVSQASPQYTVVEPDNNPTTPPQIITKVPPPPGGGGGGTVPPGGGGGGTTSFRYDLKIADTNDGRMLFDSTKAPVPLLATASTNPSDVTTGGKAIAVERSESATSTIFKGSWIDAGGVGHSVFTLTIDKATGRAEFVLTAPLDHSNHGINGSGIGALDQIRFDVIATYTDSAGVSSSGNPATIFVQDEGPVLLDIGLTVNEDGLAGGHIGGRGDIAGVGTASNADAKLSYGSDGFVSFDLSSTDSKGNPLNAPLFDLAGNVVQYEWRAAGGAAGQGAFIGFTVNGGARTDVFQLNVLDQVRGLVDVQLFAPLRHSDSTTEDNLSIKVRALAKDGDGDLSDGFVTITINDDRPEAIADIREIGVNVDPQITGNVVTGLLGDGSLSGDTADFFGADGAAANKVTGIVGYRGAGAVNTDIIGKYGTLHLNADGSYDYHLGGVGTVAPAANAADVFTYTISDRDGDAVSSTLTIKLDGRPVVVPPIPGPAPNAIQTIDEDNIGKASATTTGHLVNLGIDGANATNPFTVTLSAGQAIRDSETGNLVTLTKVDATHWEGRAAGAAGPVFTLSLNASTGDYTYTLLRSILHADAADPNDIQAIKFDVTATDKDGDVSNTGILEIDIADSAPTARNDVRSASAGSIAGNVVSGNSGGDVADSFGADGAGATKVTAISSIANGAGAVGADLRGKYGILHLNNDGSYTYTFGGGTDVPAVGQADVFSYTIQDKDGDTSQATLTINLDGTPSITPPATAPLVDEDDLAANAAKASGALVNFGLDGANATNPFAVTLATGQTIIDTATKAQVTLVQIDATHWEGRAAGAAGPVFTLRLDAATGDYEYQLLRSIQHANTSDPNDIRTIQFLVTATDSTGDTASANFNVDVADSASIANADVREIGVASGASIAGNIVTGKLANGTASGDTADILGADGGSTISAIRNFNNVAGSVNANFTGKFGVLRLNSDGSYTYTLGGTGTVAPTTGASEVFTYTLKDGDGDTSQATLTINLDGRPQVIPPTPTGGGPAPGPDALDTVDEDNIGKASSIATGRLVNFGIDGANATNPFTIALTAGQAITDTATGNAVTLVKVDATHWEGRAAGAASPVFTLSLDAVTGDYTYTLLRSIIHANASDPNDLQAIKFDVTATDKDGDVSNTGILEIDIADSAPVANADVRQIAAISGSTLAGNILTGKLVNGTASGDTADSLGLDNTAIDSIKNFNGTVGGLNADFTGKFGILHLNADGSYTYTLGGAGTVAPTVGASEVFTYTLKDGDGDTSQATLTINLDGRPVVTPPIPGPAPNAIKTVDEDNLGGLNATVSGQLVNFGIDGAATTNPFTVALTAGQTIRDTATNNIVTLVKVDATHWEGRATGAAGPVFTLSLDAVSGDYTYTLLRSIVHADGTDPNDIRAIKFDVTATDKDGDVSNTGILEIDIADSAPVANADFREIGLVNGATITGNVVTGKLANGTASGDTADVAGADGFATNIVVGLSLGGPSAPLSAGGLLGDFGRLILNADGSYTYQLGGAGAGTPASGEQDVFTYFIQDKDGDITQATLTIDIDGRPVVTPPIPGPAPNAIQTVDEDNIGKASATTRGNLVNFGIDGANATNPFTVALTAGQAITDTATGNAVTLVKVDATHWEGRATGAVGPVFTLSLDAVTGDYTYTLLRSIIHADGTNPNDIQAIKFDVTATDSDGDVSNTGILEIDIADSAPIANADLREIGVVTGATITGNVVTGKLANGTASGDTADTSGADGSVVNSIKDFSGTAGTLNADFTGKFGVLHLNADGSYTYTLGGAGTVVPTAGASEVFTYTLKDNDGDTSQATLTINLDGRPVVVPPVPGPAPNAIQTVDEDNIGGLNATVSGQLVNFGIDGASTTNPFTLALSTGQTITDTATNTAVTLGAAVQSGTKITWTGRAAGNDVFTISLYTDTGNYEYTLLRSIIHANASDPNDIRAIKFDVTATDKDGDVSNTGTLEIDVADSAPVANDDFRTAASPASGAAQPLNGNVLTGLLSDGSASGDTADVEGQDKLQANPVVDIRNNSVAGGGTTIAVNTGAGGTNIVGRFGTLTIHSDGSYTYQLGVGAGISAPIPGGSDVFTYGIRDRDGDIARASLNIALDGIPTTTNLTAAAAVDETDISAGTASVTGFGLFDFGLDGASATTPFSASLSAGQTIIDTVSGQLVTKLVSLGGDVWSGQTQTGIEVFQFSLTTAFGGFYTYTQLRSIIHPDASNPDDQVQVKLDVFVTDSDGDVSNTSTLTINVKDDAPSFSGTQNLTVLEATQIGTVRSATLGALFHEDSLNSSVPLAFQFVSSSTPLKTASGDTITIGGNGTDTLTGTDSVTGERVFTLTWNQGTGKYDFLLNEALQNPLGAAVVLNLKATAKDGDGDTATQNFSITINDGTPAVLPTITGGTVDERALPSLGPGLPSGSAPGSGPVSVSGTFGITDALFGGDGRSGDTTSHFDGITISLVGQGSSVIDSFANQIVQFTYGGNGHWFGYIDNFGGALNTFDAGIDSVVFDLNVLNEKGDYTFVLDRAIRNDLAGNTIKFDVKITDADGTNSSASRLSINVIDDAPIAHRDLVNVDTTLVSVGGKVSGNAITGFNTIPDPLVADRAFGTPDPNNVDVKGADNEFVTSVSRAILDFGGFPAGANPFGPSFAVTGAGGTDIDGDFGYLHINRDGSFYYVVGKHAGASTSSADDTVNTNYDPLVNSQDVFTYFVTDTDGSTSFSTIDIFLAPTFANIPTISAPGNTTVYEAGLAAGTQPGSVTSPTTGTGTVFVSTVDNTNLTSLSFTDPAGGALTITKGAQSVATQIANLIASGNPAFTDADGKYFITGWNAATGALDFRYVLINPLAHGASNDFVLPISISVTDGNGFSGNGTLNIHIIDDAPALNADTNTYTVPASGAGVDITGNVLSGDAKGGKADKVGADGKAADAIITVVGSGAATGSSANNWVAHGTFGDLTIDKDTGAYTYHVTSAPTSTGKSDVFTYTVKDADGDTSATTLTINFDGNPAAQNNSGIVSESALTGGAGTTTISGALINFGIDGASASTPFNVTLNTANVQTAADVARGTFINLVAGSTANTWVGRDNNGTGATIFTLSLNPTTGQYTFVLNQAIFHNGVNAASLPISFGIVGRDLDGDLSNSGTLTVTVNDDTPTPVAVTSTVTVFEEGLPNGTNGAAPVVASGTFTPNYHADGPKISTGGIDITAFNGAGNFLKDINGNVLTNNFGKNVQTIWDAASGTLYGYVTGDNTGVTARSGSAQDVFKIAFTKDAVGYTGAYTVTLLKDLRHNNNNFFDFRVTVNETDSDGDQASINFNVEVKDDGPRINPVAITLNEADIGTSRSSFTHISLGWNPGADLSPTGGGGLTIADSNHLPAQVILGTNLKGITGANIVSEWDANTHTLTAYEDLGGRVGFFDAGIDQVAVTVKLDFDSVNNRYTGFYDINLLRPIDRRTLIGGNHLQVSVTAIDQDGDKAVNPIDVTITDAVPITPGSPVIDSYTIGFGTNRSTGDIDRVSFLYRGNVFTNTGATYGTDGKGSFTLNYANELSDVTGAFTRDNTSYDHYVKLSSWIRDPNTQYQRTIYDELFYNSTTGAYQFEWSLARLVGDLPENTPSDYRFFEFKYTLVDGDGSPANGFLNFRFDNNAVFVPNEHTGGGGGGGDPVPPIVFDLNGDNHLALVNPDASQVVYDYGNDGTYNRTGWVGAEDGFLFFDLNKDRRVTESKEFVFTEWTDQAQTDLAAIAVVFDSNHDQVLDAQDEAFNQFAVWQDLNQDGISQDNEIFTLKELGIVALDLHSVGTGYDQDGNYVYGETKFIRIDGSTGLAGDVGLTVGEQVPAPLPHADTLVDPTAAGDPSLVSNPDLYSAQPFNSIDADGNLFYDPSLAAPQVALDESIWVGNQSAPLVTQSTLLVNDVPTTTMADGEAHNSDLATQATLLLDSVPVSDYLAPALLDGNSGTFWIGEGDQQVGFWGLDANGDPILLPLETPNDKMDLYADLTDVNGIWGQQHLAELSIGASQGNNLPYVHVDVPGGSGDTLPDLVATWGDEETAKDLGLADQYRTAQADTFFMHAALTAENGMVNNVLSVQDVSGTDTDIGILGGDPSPVGASGTDASHHGALDVPLDIHANLIDFGPAIPLPEADPMVQQHQLEKQNGA